MAARRAAAPLRMNKVFNNRTFEGMDIIGSGTKVDNGAIGLQTGRRQRAAGRPHHHRWPGGLRTPKSKVGLRNQNGGRPSRIVPESIRRKATRARRSDRFSRMGCLTRRAFETPCNDGDRQAGAQASVALCSPALHRRNRSQRLLRSRCTLTRHPPAGSRRGTAVLAANLRRISELRVLPTRVVTTWDAAATGGEPLCFVGIGGREAVLRRNQPRERRGVSPARARQRTRRPQSLTAAQATNAATARSLESNSCRA